MSAQGAIRDRYGPGFGLIETMRWEPGTGLLRLDRHLERLRTSAAELGLPCDAEAIQQALATINGEGALRTRLLLSASGDVSVTAQPFVPLPQGAVWTLRIATTLIDAADPLLRHKTTQRDLYQRAREEFTAREADEVILLNEQESLCEGTITNIFADFGEGALHTPPLACGLLAGVLRGELLDEGRAREAMLTPADLVDARALFVGNSLRGLIAARLAGGLSN